MKKITIFLVYILISVGLLSQINEDLSFGSDSTLDVVTWNIEWFPKEGNTTVDYVAQIIEALDCEVYAIQEIDDTVQFNQLLARLDDYDGTYETSYFAGLGYIYKKNEIVINDFYEIYTTYPYWSAFPRSPMVLDINFKGENFIIMNNHLKCCGDGIFDLSNSDDEETRRYYAMSFLKEYIDDYLSEANVIVLGDMNDILTDEDEDNVFLNVLNDTENYYFADLEIADGFETHWSYPSWPSHLDHILITNELIDELNKTGSICQTIEIDEYIDGGWWFYEENISDHRPVGIKLVIEEISGILHPEANSLKCYPNPVSDKTVFEFNSSDGGRISVCTLTGKEIQSINILPNTTKYSWDTNSLKSGIYIVKFITKNEQVSTLKVLIQ